MTFYVVPVDGVYIFVTSGRIFVMNVFYTFRFTNDELTENIRIITYEVRCNGAVR